MQRFQPINCFFMFYGNKWTFWLTFDVMNRTSISTFINISYEYVVIVIFCFDFFCIKCRLQRAAYLLVYLNQSCARETFYRPSKDYALLLYKRNKISCFFDSYSSMGIFFSCWLSSREISCVTSSVTLWSPNIRTISTVLNELAIAFRIVCIKYGKCIFLRKLIIKLLDISWDIWHTLRICDILLVNVTSPLFNRLRVSVNSFICSIVSSFIDWYSSASKSFLWKKYEINWQIRIYTLW